MENIIEFFTRITRHIPTEGQRQLLTMLVNSDIKKIIVSCGRQSGKTLTCAIATLYLSLKYNIPLRILLVSAQDNWLYDHIRSIFNGHREEFAKDILQEGTFSLVPIKGYETINGSKVHVRGCTEKNLRGIGCDIAFVDEAAEITNQSIQTVLGNLSGPISKIVLISTPHKNSLFVDIANNPDKYGFTLFHWSSEDCSWHSKELLKTKKQLLSNQAYKVEVLGLPLSAEERAFFPRKHIDKCIYEIEPIREGGPQSSIEIGIDFGFDPCPTIIVVTEKLYSKRKVLLVKTYKRKPIELIAPEIGDIIDTWNPLLVKADNKPIEYQNHIEKYTKHKIFYIDCSEHKHIMLGQLQRKIRQNELIIPTLFIDLVKQLIKYRLHKRTGDDIVDALALSCYEPVKPLSTKPLGSVIFSFKKKT